MSSASLRIVCLAICSALLIFIGSIGSQAQERTRVVHLTGDHGDSFNDYLRYQKEVFESLYPDIQVEIEVVAGNYAEAAQVRIGSGLQVDVMDSTSTFNIFSGRGMLVDLAPFLNVDPEAQVQYLPPAALQALSLNGELLGLPSQIFNTSVVYNRTLFEEMGLVPLSEMNDTWTWGDLVEMLPRLTRDHDGDGETDQFGAIFSRGLARIDSGVHQAGGAFFDRYLAPTESRFNTPEVREGLGFFVDIYRRGLANFSGTVFAGRGAAMHLHGQPNWISQIPEGGDTFGVAQQPLGPVRRGGNIAFGPFHISAASTNPDAAWTWLKFLVFNEESQLLYSQATGRIPAYLPALQDLPLYLNLPPEQVDFILGFRDTALHPDNYPRTLTPVQTAINAIFDPGFLNVLQGNEALNTFLEQADHLVQVELDRAGE